MKKHLFLDLEETLIDSIEKQQLLQGEVLKVKNFIKHHQIKEFGIFSFAIDTALEMVDLLKSRLLAVLQTELESECKSIQYTDKLRRNALICTGCNLDLFVFKTIWGKERAFIEFAEREEENGLWILIDDVVKTKLVTSLSSNGGTKHILVINIKDLSSAWVVNTLNRIQEN